ncbi:MAG: hypothetical protein ABR587_05335 [Candidatus Binatia bacterium]
MRCAFARSVVSLLAAATVLAATGRAGATGAAPSAAKPIEAAPAPAAPAVAAPAAPSAVSPPAVETPAAPTPMASPFGPGYDPTRPAPVEPKPTGPGFVSATVVAAGIGEVDELGDTGDPRRFVVVLDVRVAAGSTTALLSAESVMAKAENGNSTPLLAACTPTMADPLAVYHRPGARIASWHVAVDGQTWHCGGRTARLAVMMETGGFGITAKPGEWNGELVLFFAIAQDAPRRVVLPGLTVELPLRSDAGKDDDEAN